MSLLGWARLLLLAFVVLAFPAALMAAEGASDNPLLPPRPDLTIWTIIIFVLLLLVLKKLAWGPMLEGLNKREQNIRLAADEAKLAREETEKLRLQFKAEMDAAFAKIPLMMDEARRDAAKLAEEMRTKAAGEIQAERQRLRREIEVARDQALQELWNQAAQLATLISAKAIGRSLSTDDHTRLVDEALTEIRQSAHNK